MGSGHVRTSPGKLAAVKDWPLSETQKQVKSFVAFCSFIRNFLLFGSINGMVLKVFTKEGGTFGCH